MNEDDREHLFDNRILDRRLAAGQITSADLDKHLAELEDCSEQGVECDARFVHTAKLDPRIHDDR